MNERFTHLAAICARWVGSPMSFAAHLALLVASFALIPIWGLGVAMLTVTTVLTITTELIAVLISNTQNRQERAMQRKLDEIIRAIEGARDELIGIEEDETQ